MKCLKIRNTKKTLRGRKPMYQLYPRQRRRMMMNLLQQNGQNDNNMQVDNRQNALIDFNPTVAPALHNFCVHSISNVHEERSELSLVVTAECN